MFDGFGAPVGYMALARTAVHLGMSSQLLDFLKSRVRLGSSRVRSAFVILSNRLAFMPLLF